MRPSGGTGIFRGQVSNKFTISFRRPHEPFRSFTEPSHKITGRFLRPLLDFRNGGNSQSLGGVASTKGIGLC